MMLYPSVQELTSNGVNRYALVIAAAKGARHVTEDMAKTRRKLEERRESDRMNSRDLKTEAMADSLNEKAVSVSIKHIYEGDYKILMPNYKDDAESDNYDAQTDYSDVVYDD